MESGATWDDPDEERLFYLLNEIDQGDEEFIAIDRLTDPSGQTYAQAVRCDDETWAVEHRDGSADRHYRASCPDLGTAHYVLSGWAFGRSTRMDVVRWERVTV